MENINKIKEDIENNQKEIKSTIQEVNLIESEIAEIDKIMIENGVGIIKVSDENLEEFNKLLSEFYTTNNKEIIKGFLYNKCIFGIEF